MLVKTPSANEPSELTRDFLGADSRKTFIKLSVFSGGEWRCVRCGNNNFPLCTRRRSRIWFWPLWLEMKGRGKRERGVKKAEQASSEITNYCVIRVGHSNANVWRENWRSIVIWTVTIFSKWLLKLFFNNWHNAVLLLGYYFN